MMSPEAKEEYEKALTAAVLKHGTMVSRDASFYGWQDYNYHSGSWGGRRNHVPHHLTCELVSIGKPKEDTWDEFQGTFYEGDTSVHGISVQVSCKCGEIYERTFRWAASMQEVAEAVFEEAFGKKAESAEPTEEKPRKGGNFDDDVDTTPGGVPWNYN